MPNFTPCSKCEKHQPEHLLVECSMCEGSNMFCDDECIAQHEAQPNHNTQPEYSDYASGVRRRDHRDFRQRIRSRRLAFNIENQAMADMDRDRRTLVDVLTPLEVSRLISWDRRFNPEEIRRSYGIIMPIIMKISHVILLNHQHPDNPDRLLYDCDRCVVEVNRMIRSARELMELEDRQQEMPEPSQEETHEPRPIESEEVPRPETAEEMGEVRPSITEQMLRSFEYSTRDLE